MSNGILCASLREGIGLERVPRRHAEYNVTAQVYHGNRYYIATSLASDRQRSVVCLRRLVIDRRAVTSEVVGMGSWDRVWKAKRRTQRGT